MAESEPTTSTADVSTFSLGGAEITATQRPDGTTEITTADGQTIQVPAGQTLYQTYDPATGQIILTDTIPEGMEVADMDQQQSVVYQQDGQQLVNADGTPVDPNMVAVLNEQQTTDQTAAQGVTVLQTDNTTGDVASVPQQLTSQDQPMDATQQQLPQATVTQQPETTKSPEEQPIVITHDMVVTINGRKCLLMPDSSGVLCGYPCIQDAQGNYVIDKSVSPVAPRRGRGRPRKYVDGKTKQYSSESGPDSGEDEIRNDIMKARAGVPPAIDPRSRSGRQVKPNRKFRDYHILAKDGKYVAKQDLSSSDTEWDEASGEDEGGYHKVHVGGERRKKRHKKTGSTGDMSTSSEDELLELEKQVERELYGDDVTKIPAMPDPSEKPPAIPAVIIPGKDGKPVLLAPARELFVMNAYLEHHKLLPTTDVIKSSADGQPDSTQPEGDEELKAKAPDTVGDNEAEAAKPAKVHEDGDAKEGTIDVYDLESPELQTLFAALEKKAPETPTVSTSQQQPQHTPQLSSDHAPLTLSSSQPPQQSSAPPSTRHKRGRPPVWKSMLSRRGPTVILSLTDEFIAKLKTVPNPPMPEPSRPDSTRKAAGEGGVGEPPQVVGLMPSQMSNPNIGGALVEAGSGDMLEERKILNCNGCGYVCHSRSLMKQHVQNSHPDIGRHCALCKFASVGDVALVEHYRLRHTGFICDQCNMIFENTSDCHVHRKSHNPDTPSCELCGKVFKDRYILRIHMKHVHEPTDILYECDICQKKFSKKAHVRRHARQHAEAKSYECPSCDYRGVERSDLAKHLMIHDTPRFVCEVCDKPFRHPRNLELHMKRHIGQRDFKCGICNYYGYTSTDIRKHIERRHAQIAVFQCIRCGMVFRTELAFRDHQLNCTAIGQLDKAQLAVLQQLQLEQQEEVAAQELAVSAQEMSGAFVGQMTAGGAQRTEAEQAALSNQMHQYIVKADGSAATPEDHAVAMQGMTSQPQQIIMHHQVPGTPAIMGASDSTAGILPGSAGGTATGQQMQQIIQIQNDDGSTSLIIPEGMEGLTFQGEDGQTFTIGGSGEIQPVASAAGQSVLPSKAESTTDTTTVAANAAGAESKGQGAVVAQQTPQESPTKEQIMAAAVAQEAPEGVAEEDEPMAQIMINDQPVNIPLSSLQGGGAIIEIDGQQIMISTGTEEEAAAALQEASATSVGPSAAAEGATINVTPSDTDTTSTIIAEHGSAAAAPPASSQKTTVIERNVELTKEKEKTPEEQRAEDVQTPPALGDESTQISIATKEGQKKQDSKKREEEVSADTDDKSAPSPPIHRTRRATAKATGSDVPSPTRPTTRRASSQKAQKEAKVDETVSSSQKPETVTEESVTPPSRGPSRPKRALETTPTETPVSPTSKRTRQASATATGGESATKDPSLSPKQPPAQASLPPHHHGTRKAVAAKEQELLSSKKVVSSSKDTTVITMETTKETVVSTAPTTRRATRGRGATASTDETQKSLSSSSSSTSTPARRTSSRVSSAAAKKEEHDADDDDDDDEGDLAIG